MIWPPEEMVSSRASKATHDSLNKAWKLNKELAPRTGRRQAFFVFGAEAPSPPWRRRRGRLRNRPGLWGKSRPRKQARGGWVRGVGWDVQVRDRLLFLNDFQEFPWSRRVYISCFEFTLAGSGRAPCFAGRARYPGAAVKDNFDLFVRVLSYCARVSLCSRTSDRASSAGAIALVQAASALVQVCSCKRAHTAALQHLCSCKCACSSVLMQVRLLQALACV